MKMVKYERVDLWALYCTKSKRLLAGALSWAEEHLPSHTSCCRPVKVRVEFVKPVVKRRIVSIAPSGDMTFGKVVDRLNSKATAKDWMVVKYKRAKR